MASPCDGSGLKHAGKRAFTLIELLTVIAIVAMLATAAAPALSSLSKGGSMNQSLVELAGLFDQARQYAIAQNTYVWVAMRPDPAASDGDSLSVVVLASSSGIDPAPWSDYGAVPNSQIKTLTKPRTFSQIRLEEAGAFSGTQVRDLPATPSVGTANSPANGTAIFQIKIPGTASPSTFRRIVQFTPDGQARVAANPIDVVEFGVHPMRGNVADAKNVAVLRINGLTGQTAVYRP